MELTICWKKVYKYSKQLFFLFNVLELPNKIKVYEKNQNMKKDGSMVRNIYIIQNEQASSENSNLCLPNWWKFLFYNKILFQRVQFELSTIALRNSHRNNKRQRISKFTPLCSFQLKNNYPCYKTSSPYKCSNCWPNHIWKSRNRQQNGILTFCFTSHQTLLHLYITL